MGWMGKGEREDERRRKVKDGVMVSEGMRLAEEWLGGLCVVAGLGFGVWAPRGLRGWLS